MCSILWLLLSNQYSKKKMAGIRTFELCCYEISSWQAQMSFKQNLLLIAEVHLFEIPFHIYKLAILVYCRLPFNKLAYWAFPMGNNLKIKHHQGMFPRWSGQRFIKVWIGVSHVIIIIMALVLTIQLVWQDFCLSYLDLLHFSLKAFC